MVLTLAWKEYREHRSIWVTMVLVTALMVYLLAPLIAPRDASMTQSGVLGIIVLGMAAAYGLVCGSMMLAGEAENGTQVFLDIFLGRRGLLWSWKLLVGAVLAATEGLAVAAVLYFMKQAPPNWLPTFIGQGAPALRDQGGRIVVGPALWFAVLPVVTLEAYAWGLLGSSLARLVLSGAAIAAMIAAPFLLVALLTPAPASLYFRGIGVIAALAVSCAAFMAQSRDVALGPPPKSDDSLEPKWIEDVWDDQDEYEPEPLLTERDSARAAAAAAYGSVARAPRWVEVIDDEAPVRAASLAAATDVPAYSFHKQAPAQDADSPWQALWWLTYQQAWMVFLIIAGASLVLGIFMPTHGQVLWPLTTLAIGVACGTATFASEQSERSYQFLAAGHFPLSQFWIVKMAFWWGAGLAAALIAGGGILLAVLARSLGTRPDFGRSGLVDFGTLRTELGPLLFYSMWLVYGFSVGQVFVLLCRKNILAVLLSAVVSAAAVGIWLPSLLCRGMSGWQVWLPPLSMLAGTWFMIRAWAAGRIKERRPMAMLVGIGVAGLAWLGVQLAFRAWSIPDTGEPLDRVEFRAALSQANDNRGGQKVQEALQLDRGAWLERLTEASRLPAGIIETPPGDGPSPMPRYLDPAGNAAGRLSRLAEDAWDNQRADIALQHIERMLALSRNLRNKAPQSAYLLGVSIEESALRHLQRGLGRSKPTAAIFKRALAELTRHAADTPAASDCVRTECYRAGGAVKNTIHWSFYAGDDKQRVPERWLAGAVALSLELPWEEERKLRLWRAVWAGLLRSAELPHWELPQGFGSKPDTGKQATREIMSGWLPDENNPSLTRDRLVTLLDQSWLSDPRLFTPVVTLRDAGTRSRCRLEACRLAMALGQYQIQEGKPAQKLAELVPKYLPELPVDPYSGKSFHYRLSAGEPLEAAGENGDIGAREFVNVGHGILWSTGPDRINHGGRRDGARLSDDPAFWHAGSFDLITIVPRWQ